MCKLLLLLLIASKVGAMDDSQTNAELQDFYQRKLQFSLQLSIPTVGLSMPLGLATGGLSTAGKGAASKAGKKTATGLATAGSGGKTGKGSKAGSKGRTQAAVAGLEQGGSISKAASKAGGSKGKSATSITGLEPTSTSKAGKVGSKGKGSIVDLDSIPSKAGGSKGTKKSAAEGGDVSKAASKSRGPIAAAAESIPTQVVPGKAKASSSKSSPPAGKEGLGATVSAKEALNGSGGVVSMVPSCFLLLALGVAVLFG